jgi:hypothetical protein
MVKVIIFAILFLTEETQETTPCLLMVYSDAQPVQFWPVECETYNEHSPDGVFYKCYQHQWQNSDELVFQFTDDVLTPEDYEIVAVTQADVQIAVAPFVATVMTDRVVYFATLQADEDGFSNTLVYFVIRFVGGSNIAKSDGHNFVSAVGDSILMTYYNHINVFGLIYEDASPDLQFKLRIPAIFYHQRFPEEDEVMELTSELVTLNGSMRRQRLLDTDYLPYYIHEKIKLALKHQFVLIYNKFWTKQESYDIQDGNRMHPEKKAKCWMSETEYMQRSVL